MALTASAVASQSTYAPPRNTFGQPDLEGVWNFSSDVPLERPPAFADKIFFSREELQTQNAIREQNLDSIGKLAPVEIVDRTWLDYQAQIENLRTSLVVYPENGRLPPLVDGVQRIGGVAAFLDDIKGARPVRFLFGGIGKEAPEDRGLAERCIAGSNTAPPFVPGFDANYVQIFQTNDHVLLLADTITSARRVPLDKRPPLGDTLRSWSGDSRGHWDGDTLVVTTSNFNGRSQSLNDAGTSYDKVVTERFTRVSATALQYEATIVDSKTFRDRIVLAFPMARVDAGIYETACHEGNYSMRAMLGGARRAEQEAIPH